MFPSIFCNIMLVILKLNKTKKDCRLCVLHTISIYSCLEATLWMLGGSIQPPLHDLIPFSFGCGFMLELSLSVSDLFRCFHLVASLQIRTYNLYFCEVVYELHCNLWTDDRYAHGPRTHHVQIPIFLGAKLTSRTQKYFF